MWDLWFRGKSVFFVFWLVLGLSHLLSRPSYELCLPFDSTAFHNPRVIHSSSLYTTHTFCVGEPCLSWIGDVLGDLVLASYFWIDFVSDWCGHGKCIIFSSSTNFLGQFFSAAMFDLLGVTRKMRIYSWKRDGCLSNAQSFFAVFLYTPFPVRSGFAGVIRDWASWMPDSPLAYRARYPPCQIPRRADF